MNNAGFACTPRDESPWSLVGGFCPPTPRPRGSAPYSLAIRARRRGQSPHYCGCEGRTLAPEGNKNLRDSLLLFAATNGQGTTLLRKLRCEEVAAAPQYCSAGSPLAVVPAAKRTADCSPARVRLLGYGARGWKPALQRRRDRPTSQVPSQGTLAKRLSPRPVGRGCRLRRLGLSGRDRSRNRSPNRPIDR